MWEWIQENAWAVWLVIAGGLAISEMLTLDLTLLMLAVGALAGGVTALILPGLVWAQVLVAIGVAIALLGLLRPSMLRRISRGPGYQSSVEQIVGSSGRTTREVTATDGAVKINGEIWSARSYDGQPIAVGIEVEIFEIDGVIAVVYPKDKPLSAGTDQPLTSDPGSE
ncbi:MAG: NfeD family protein [Propioniciclava sp.]